MTAPLPPSAPLLLDVSATLVRVKWYPPPGGAVKFLVQLRALSPSSAASSSSARGGEGWTVAFNGQETVWACTTMAPDAEFECRVVALNCQGTASDPSGASRLLPLLPLRPLHFSSLATA